MAKLTWLGPDDYEEGETPPSSCTWGDITFPMGKAVNVDEAAYAHMVQKARGNRLFRVEENAPPQSPQPEQSLPIGLIRPETWTNTPPAAFPDYPPEDEHKRKRGRPPKPRDVDNGDQ